MSFSDLQISEISRCANDFVYFCSKYVKIDDNPFLLRQYQIDLYEHLEDNNFSIFSKYRKGGFTTELLLYGLWQCLFKLNQNVYFTTCSPALLNDAGRLIKNVIKKLPKWMTGNVLKMPNDMYKSFPETSSEMHFIDSQVVMVEIKPISLLIVDEASFINSMNNYTANFWTSCRPLVCESTEGKCIITSTMNSEDDWFWRVIQESKIKMNDLEIFYTYYKDNQAYDKEWEQRTIGQIGIDAFNVEYLQQAKSNKVIEKLVKAEIRTIWDDWSISQE